jgi:hypothetical protein
MLRPNSDRYSAGAGRNEFMTLPHTRCDTSAHRQLASDSSDGWQVSPSSENFKRTVGCGARMPSQEQAQTVTGFIIQRPT